MFNILFTSSWDQKKNIIMAMPNNSLQKNFLRP